MTMPRAQPKGIEARLKARQRPGRKQQKAALVIRRKKIDG